MCTFSWTAQPLAKTINIINSFQSAEEEVRWRFLTLSIPVSDEDGTRRLLFDCFEKELLLLYCLRSSQDARSTWARLNCFPTSFSLVSESPTISLDLGFSWRRSKTSWKMKVSWRKGKISAILNFWMSRQLLTHLMIALVLILFDEVGIIIISIYILHIL